MFSTELNGFMTEIKIIIIIMSDLMLPQFRKFTFTLNLVYSLGKLRLCSFCWSIIFLETRNISISKFRSHALQFNFEFILPVPPES